MGVTADSDTQARVEEIILARFRLRAGFILAQERLEDLVLDTKVTFDESFDRTMDRVLLRITAAITSAKVGVFEYPADWWQAFKWQWFPKWALRRWPVNMARVEARALFPDRPWPKDLGREFLAWEPCGWVGEGKMTWPSDARPSRS